MAYLSPSSYLEVKAGQGTCFLAISNLKLFGEELVNSTNVDGMQGRDGIDSPENVTKGGISGNGKC